MNETDAGIRVPGILDELNSGRLGRAWDQYARTLPEYDAKKTRTVYQGAGVAFVALNTIFRYDPQDGRWIFQDFGSNETSIP